MKHYLTITLLGFLFPFLVSCEKDEVTPKEPTATQTKSARTNAPCTYYAYMGKDGAIVNYGKAQGDLILVSFAPGTAYSTQQHLLNDFPEFIKIEGTASTETRQMAVVRLKPNTTCAKVDALLKSLETYAQVDLAAPTFDNGTAEDGSALWSGLTDEILVAIDPAELDSFLRFVESTNTKIAVSFSDDFHILSVDKYATGNVLKIASMLNQLPYMVAAEPSLLFQGPGAPLQLSKNQSKLALK